MPVNARQFAIGEAAATATADDLPAGRHHLLQRAQGQEATFVSGGLGAR